MLFIVNYYCHHNLLFIFMYILLKFSTSRWPVCSVGSTTILGDCDNDPDKDTSVSNNTDGVLYRTYRAV